MKSSQNVVAYIKGSEFPDEVLIISAHLDHLGTKDEQIYNGADDNGSGTAALMEIAEAFKLAESNGHPPKRSVLFLHLTGEEESLEGSRYYITHPIFSLDKTIANLNIDMIGRSDKSHKDHNNYIYLIGSDRLSNELHYISEAANQKFTKLELDYKYNDENDSNNYYSRSDHYNFALRGIPVIFYFSGTHDDYHQPTDTADKLNYPLLEKRTKLIFTTAWYLANSEKRISVDIY
jgi:Zn-dependent M28 family amino/carboxypeptidase